MDDTKHTDKIAIIVHPIYRFLMDEFEPGLQKFSRPVAERILEQTNPFFISRVDGVVSQVSGELLDAELIMCPLLMEQMAGRSRHRVFKRVLQCIELALSRDAKLVNLVAYTAMIAARNARKIVGRIETPITTGINMTMAVIPKAVFAALDALGFGDYGKVRALVFGVNPMARMVVTRLAQSVDRVYVAYHSREQLREFYDSLSDAIRKKVVVSGYDSGAVIRTVDVVVNATGRLPDGFDAALLKTGALVYDASYPRAIESNRTDVLVIDGVAMEVPGNPDFHLNFGLPEGLCFPCMAEAITLAFEGRYESYSLDKNIMEEKADDIYMQALRHGFKMGPLTSGELVVPESHIRQVRDAARSDMVPVEIHA